MKNFTKKMSWLGLSIALTMPVGMLLACNKDKAVELTFDTPDISEANAINLNKVDLSKFKDAAILNGITKQEVDSIKIEDVQKYRTNDKNLSKDKKDLIQKIDNFLTKFAFENNTNPEIMGHLQDWINNASLSIYNAQSLKRGPWRSRESHGTTIYYRDDFLNYRSSVKNGGFDLLGSDFVPGSGHNAKRFIRGFNTTSIPKKGDRTFDNTIIRANSMTGGMGSGYSFSIFRTKSTGKYKYEVDKNDKTGKKTWTSTEKEITRLFGGLDFQINGNTPENRTYEKIKELVRSQPKESKIVFSNSSNSVNYGEAKNGNAVDSGKVFKAKDLFYGLVRGLYSSKEFRKEGIVEGVDLSDYVKKLTEAQKTKWNNLFKDEASANSFNNGNMYLYKLYGLDLKETVKLNLESKDDDKFILKFNGFKETSMDLFRDSTAINPFPMSEMKKPTTNTTGANYLDADMMNIFEYGNPYSGRGEINPEGIYSLAPFIYTEYSISERKFQVIKQNPVYFDQEWVKKPNSILGYSQENKVKGIDSSSYAQARLNQFKKAAETEEYILDSEIYSLKSLLKQVKNYRVYKKPNRTGIAPASRMSWNLYGFGDKSINDLGRKMLWGFDKVYDIKNKPIAMRNFFSGSGAKTRAAINSSVNWYAMAQTLYPGQNKEFYPGIALDNDFKTSKVDVSKAYPTYLSSNENMKQIYDSNLNDRFKAWTPSTVATAAKTLDEIATSVGATKDRPAKIGVFKYIWLNDKASDQVLQTNKLILKRLNTLTPKVKFTNQKEYSWDDFVTYAWKKKTSATTLGGFGPDYLGLGTINQQYLTKYGSFGVIGLFMDAFAE